MNTIAVCPTRGLVFEQTINSIRATEIELNREFLVESGNLPTVQNDLVRQALESYPDYIWFIEDDMQVPEGTLRQMVKMDKAIIAVDYPVDNGYSTITRQKDEILWCGLGCTLVRRGVLEAVGDPWFTIDHSWRIDSENPFKITKIDNPSKYGGHYINFVIRARELGYEIHQLPGVEAKHLRTTALQKGQGNDGVFEVTELEISQRVNY